MYFQIMRNFHELRMPFPAGAWQTPLDYRPEDDMAHLSFTEHPASVGETYGEHFATALYFGGRLMAAGLACVVHAVLPFLFTRTASRTIADLHARMIGNRVRPPHGGFYQPNFEI
jgi:hypothetical protein